ncbi:MAG TPA: aminotransferase class III-fold pyridoxal phosphate-dependent enzyme [Methanocella sp.]|jgi:glutamate-1-semialdehyde aminotransferase
MVNSGVKLWNRAKQIIPGGNQLLSKRSDRFLPDYWPSYYKKAKGIEVWDLDDNHYIDMSIMGIGSCTLGYADEDVNKAVIDAVKNSSMCTLNCPEEVELAEVLLKLEPWADMVRYARSGGEACAMAVRIARASTGKDKVAFCGYHGWSDWYLAANLADDKALDGHLLEGLSPKGVPRGLIHTAIPFNYNHIEELEAIVRNNKGEIGAIIMEPVRNYSPDNKFLKQVRKITDEIGAVLIFDEVTSGFRLTLGGAHKLYGVDPDLLVFAKALGNGHACGAVIGRKEVMEIVQETFISSTNWTERIGSAAALATIEKMRKVKSAEHLIKTGEYIGKNWRELADAHGLQYEIIGIPPLTTIVFKYPGETPQILQTLFTQEMLPKGYLGWPHVYVCTGHTKEVVDTYMEHVDDVFGTMKKAVDSGHPEKMLKGPVASKGFARLT